jgi:hypothetical protein
MIMDTKQIRRDALALWLRGLRLPLTTVETLTKRGEDASSWPPAIAFEKVEAAVKGTIGRITRDDTLIAMASLQQTEVTQREQSLAKKAEAEATRAEVRREAEANQAELERERRQAEHRAKEREQQLEQDKRRAQQQVEQQTAKKKGAVRKQAAARTKAIDAQATKAEADRLRKEADALRAKERAVAAEGEVLELAKAERATKAARRAG